LIFAFIDLMKQVVKFSDVVFEIRRHEKDVA